MSAAGALQFARYAYPPNELGYCGPVGAQAMLDPGAGEEIERRARQFEGAWSYLEMLAETAGLSDPLDERVVDAYWLGGELLDAVDPAALVARLEDRFLGQVGGTWRSAAARARARAHHSFQVFEVYPWAGLLKDGRPPEPAVQVLDRCRIRVGEVLSVDGEKVRVASRLLAWDGLSLHETEPVVEQARWSAGGQALIDVPEVGELMALHWDWVCAPVSPDQGRTIVALEASALSAAGLAG